MKTRSQKLNLLKVLCAAQLRSSDYRSAAGALWSFMGPLLTFSVTYFIFVDRFGRAIPYFPLTLLTGIISLSFFTSAVSYVIKFFQRNRDIFINSKAPPEILLAAHLFVPLLKFLTELSLCAVLAAVLGILTPAGFAGVLLLIPFFVLLAAGVGLYLAVLGTLAGDIEEIWTVVAHTLIFVSPVFYQLPMISPWARTLITCLNPVTPFMLSFQALITGQNIPGFEPGTLFQAAAYALAALSVGWTTFRKMEKQVVESL